jgi:hypothetical protein
MTLEVKEKGKRRGEISRKAGGRGNEIKEQEGESRR